MKRSTERILTSHTGSLPRPDDLIAMLYAREEGRENDPRAMDERIRSAVAETVDHQRSVGLDVINDGEMGRLSYYSYVQDRLTGFGGHAPPNLGAWDLADYPEFAESSTRSRGMARVQARRPACIGEVSYTSAGVAACQQDVDNLKAAASAASAADVFMSAASPGIISLFMENQHYPDREAYLWALGNAMKAEYDTIAASGLLLQVDCPDLAMAWNTIYKGSSVAEFRTVVELHLAVLDHATRDVPPEQLRMHLCWGNYEGPHHHDIPLGEIVDLIFAARPMAVSFEGANPRHEHEYVVWDDYQLPAGKIIMPGVLDSTTNFIEHPELIAQRILRYAERVGRENVIPGTDCGFSTGAGMGFVDPRIAWAKFQSLNEGARLASERLWG